MHTRERSVLSRLHHAPERLGGCDARSVDQHRPLGWNFRPDFCWVNLTNGGLWWRPAKHRDERRVHHRGNKVEPSYRTGERNLAIDFDVLPLIRDLCEKEIGFITREA